MIITGMHRSGTSLVSQISQRLGLPDPFATQLPADVGNPGGYFESRDVVTLDDSLLADMAASWDATPDLLSAHWQEVPGSTVEEWRKGLDLPPADDWQWSIKDPRLCFLIGAWDRILLRRAPVVLCIRHPASVAQSLYLRVGFNEVHSLTLWGLNTAAVADAASTRPVLIGRARYRFLQRVLQW